MNDEILGQINDNLNRVMHLHCSTNKTSINFTVFNQFIILGLLVGSHFGWNHCLSVLPADPSGP